VSLCTTVVHNTTQNSSDNFLSYPPDNPHSSNDVYCRGQVTVTTCHLTKIYETVKDLSRVAMLVPVQYRRHFPPTWRPVWPLPRAVPGTPGSKTSARRPWCRPPAVKRQEHTALPSQWRRSCHPGCHTCWKPPLTSAPTLPWHLRRPLPVLWEYPKQTYPLNHIHHLNSY